MRTNGLSPDHTTTGTGISEVNFGNADLTGANLSEASIHETNFKGATASSSTIFPPGFNAKSEGINFK